MGLDDDSIQKKYGLKFKQEKKSQAKKVNT